MGTPKDTSVPRDKSQPPTIVELVIEEPQAAGIRSFISAPHCGALVVFEGVARATSTQQGSEGKIVVGLEYEAYQSLYFKVLADLIKEIRATWKTIWGIAVQHRVGYCPVGETGVVVGVTAPHRLEAFHACEQLISKIKEKAPIWKQEVFEIKE